MNKVSKASITLARALTIYYTEHGVNIPSHTSVKTHCEKLIDYWKDALLSDLSIREQRVFKAHLETLGCSEGYIQRIFTTLRAATNFCYKNEYIDQPVNIMSISVPMHNNVEMGRPLSLEEMARLFDAIELDYLMRYCLLMLGTLARPTAIMELHSLQLDHDYRLITLNPPGRKQTKKYRPTVKMPEFIHQATRHLADCNIISGSNVPIKSVKTSFATAIKKAELTGKVTGYSFRHTMTRWLRSQSVPPWEVAAQLGHRMEQYSTTEIYAPYDPSYLSNCVEAIEGYFEELSKQCMAVQNFVTN